MYRHILIPLDNSPTDEAILQHIRELARMTGETVLVGIIREDHPIAPSRDDSLEPHDELLFISTPEFEDELEAMLSPGERNPRGEA